MAKRYLGICMAAAILGIGAGFASVPGGLDYFRFKAGNLDQARETSLVQDSLKLFSASMAGFYASGGSPEGLRMFPAEMLVKRRVFMDISMSRSTGVLMVMDRDSREVKALRFVDPTHAVAVVDEHWVNQYQDAVTRRPVSDKKANVITVRYLLKKHWGRWVVMEYEVFGRGDTIPPLDERMFVRW